MRQDIEGAKADLASASAAIGVKERQIAQSRALTDQAAAGATTARIVRDYIVLRASRAGVVSERLVSPGTLVQPGMPILRIQDDSQVRLQANVAEADLAAVRVGCPVTVTTQRAPGLEIHARVTSVFGAADAQARTTVVEALVPNPGRRLVAGQYVVMQIATDVPRTVLTVPQAAVQRSGDAGAYVWTMVAGKQDGKTIYSCVMHPEVQSDKPGKCPKCGMDLVPTKEGGKFVAHRVAVTLGPSDGRRVVVESGLQDGDEVIVAGGQALNAGDAVRAGDGGSGMGAGPKPAGGAAQAGSPVRETDAAARPPRTAAPLYVCPMDPEVRSAKPGKCPKCGMNLELAAGGTGHGGH